MKKCLYISTILLLSMIGCKKTDENPQLKDPFYQHYTQELSAYENILKSLEAELAKKKFEVQDVIPQTGQIKRAQKMFFEKESQISKVKQNIKFLKIKIAQRTQEAQQEYQASLKSGSVWPDPTHFERFKQQNEMNQKILDKTKKPATPTEEVPAESSGH